VFHRLQYLLQTYKKTPNYHHDKGKKTKSSLTLRPMLFVLLTFLARIAQKLKENYYFCQLFQLKTIFQTF